MLLNLSLRLRVFLIFAALAMTILLLVAAGMWVVNYRLGVSAAAAAGAGTGAPVAMPALVTGGLLAGLGSVGAVAWVWLLFDQNVARPIERLSGGLRTGSTPEGHEGRYLADLAPAARSAAEARARAAEALAQEVQRHATDLQHDRTMLETILAELDAGVVMADEEGRVLFYDRQAARLLPRLAVGRPLGPALEPGALAAWCALLDDPTAADGVEITCAMPDGRVLCGRLRRVGDGSDRALLLVLRPDCPFPAGASGRQLLGTAHDFQRTGPDADNGTPRLDRLACVVFDTEATGLDPVTSRIVQIAGVRVSRGRLTGERFDALVNPGCPIPALSTRIHGITDAMVADAPDIKRVLDGFAHFAGSEILLAHNAPYDMGLLRAVQKTTGLSFDNPVLDTVLLSAMIWGGSADHSLDALAARLGVEIPADDRHTAMGDALATAECFLRLIPALQQKGIATLADVRREARRFRSLIVDANELPARA